MNDIFFNEHGRLRSGWRFGFFAFVFTFFYLFLLTFIFTILSAFSLKITEYSILTFFISAFVPLIIAVSLGYLCGKYFEDLPFRALGFWFTKFWLKDFIIGLLVGFLSISLACLLAMGFGKMSFELNSASNSSAIFQTFAVSGFIFLIAAAFEEALFRGYIFQTFTRAKLVFFAILLTSALFATIHNGNPSANYFSWINTFIAGIWLGVAYLKTRTLWFVFGIHFAWNWFQGAFFGIEVSGLTEMLSAPLLKESDAGPSWITGGDYGIEGGIACTIALIISTILIWFLPILKPTEEMLELTSKEKPINLKTLENI